MATEKTVIQQMEEEYPEIAREYKKILKEQYELFAGKMLDYGLDNISMGTRLETQDEKKGRGCGRGGKETRVGWAGRPKREQGWSIRF